jgi:type IV pilus assembly protein PilC
VAQFVCRLGTPEGRVLEEVHTANNEATLRGELEKRGLHVFDIKPKGLGRLGGGGLFERGPRAMPADEFLIFNQELAALLKAGLPLLQALNMMTDRMDDSSFRPVLSDIRDRVESGADLSEAFGAHEELFPRLYPSALKAGEKSGELESVIRRFIRYQRLMLDARRRVISALIYPAVLIVTSITMVAVLMVYVMPKFLDFYDSLEGELPLLTQITLGISVFLSTHWKLELVLLVAAWFGFRAWKKTEAGRLSLDTFKLKLPLVGSILRRLALSEFTRALGTLLAGGIPLVPAYQLASEAVGNTHVRGRIEPKVQMVREGRAFHEALEAAEVFPPMALDMIQVGEATGALDDMLNSVSELFDEQVETQVGRILSVIEPIMLVIMGIIVGLILVSLYLPMFSMIGGGGGAF